MAYYRKGGTTPRLKYTEDSIEEDDFDTEGGGEEGGFNIEDEVVRVVLIWSLQGKW